jgi:hypothetical protein
VTGSVEYRTRCSFLFPKLLVATLSVAFGGSHLRSNLSPALSCSAIGCCTVPLSSLSSEASPSWYPLFQSDGSPAGSLQLSLWYQRPPSRVPRDNASSAAGLSRSVYRSNAASVLRRVVSQPGGVNRHGSAKSLLLADSHHSSGGVADVGSLSLDADSSLQPVVISSTSPDCAVAFGEPLRLDVVATGSPPLAYQWMMEMDHGALEPLDGETHSTLSMAEFHGYFAGVYACQVSNPCGAVISRRIAVVNREHPPASTTTFSVGPPSPTSPAASPAASSTEPVVIQRVSDDCRVGFGDQLRLEVVASGSPNPSYQWYMETSGYGNIKMDGETSSVLVVPDFCDDLVGTYTCHVSNPSGTVVSRAIRVDASL